MKDLPRHGRCAYRAVISLAGNAGAVTYLVTSKQIKDGTIQLRDLSPATKSALILPMTQNKFRPQEDMHKVCLGVKSTQNNVDSLYSATGYIEPFWYPDLRNSGCSFSYAY